jgi:hypothetical protein
MLLAIDPGMNSPGVALYDIVRREVRAANALEIPSDWVTIEAGQRWRAVGDEIVRWTQNAVGGFVALTDIIFEKPHWYARHKSKGDPNQLVGIAGVAANVTGAMRTVTGIRSPEPSEWIGQLPKVCPVCEGRKTAPRTDGKRGRGKPRICSACNNSAWGTPRGRRIWSKLTDKERAVVPDQNDAIDAVGLALYWDRRLERVSIFSNGHDGR